MTHYPNEQILVEASIINKPAKAWEKASVHRLAVVSFRASKRSMLTARGLYPDIRVVVVGGGGGDGAQNQIKKAHPNKLL